jgi:hypothetical protein
MGLIGIQQENRPVGIGGSDGQVGVAPPAKDRAVRRPAVGEPVLDLVSSSVTKSLNSSVGIFFRLSL